MPDDPKAGNVGEDTSAAPAGASGNDTPSGGQQTTAEQDRIAQIERERDELRQKYEDEHRLRMAHEQKVREVNAQEREGRQRATDADPLDAEIAALEQTVSALAANNQRDIVTERELRRAREEREALDARRELEARVAQARRDLEGVPEPYRRRTWELWQTQQFWTVGAAYQAAKGEESDVLRKKLEQRETDEKKREAEVIARQNAAPGSPRAGGGGASSGSKPMPLSEYVNRLNDLQRTDPAAAAQLVSDKDSGKIVLDRSG
jgi:hypothetical protein